MFSKKRLGWILGGLWLAALSCSGIGCGAAGDPDTEGVVDHAPSLRVASCYDDSGYTSYCLDQCGAETNACLSTCCSLPFNATPEEMDAYSNCKEVWEDCNWCNSSYTACVNWCWYRCGW